MQKNLAAADNIILSDGTSVETELAKKVEGWTLAGTVNTTSLITISVPNTAKEVLAACGDSTAYYTSIVIPKALLSSAWSIKRVGDNSKELYYNGSKWKVTDVSIHGKIYYR